MTVTATDAYLAEFNGMKRLADLPRPNVPFTAETIHGALCLWRTNGDGSHLDNVRLHPTRRLSVMEILEDATSSPLRAPGGTLLVRAVEGSIGVNDAPLLDRLTTGPRSTGFLMARSLDSILSESEPRLRNGGQCLVRAPASMDEYLEMRRLVASIFGSGASSYDPETDFYGAPDEMTYLAAYAHGKVVSAASLLIVDGIANMWSVCTHETARGRGIASAVVHACLVEAHRQGAHSAALGTSQELSRPGGIYHRLGFRTVGHEHGWTITDLELLSLEPRDPTT